MITLELQATAEQHARNLRRWEEIARDPQFKDTHPSCVETDRYGNLILMAPPTYQHDFFVSRIVNTLEQLLGPNSLASLGISTTDGTKVCDAAWISPQRHSANMNAGKILPVQTPEIVVEVMSPGNAWDELLFKGQLYCDAGAEEYWVCDTEGKLHVFLADKPTEPVATSLRCPNFPTSLPNS